MYAVKVNVQQLDNQTVYTMQHPELPGCMVVGTDPIATLHDLEAFRPAWIAFAREKGMEVAPEPPGEARLEIEYDLANSPHSHAIQQIEVASSSCVEFEFAY